ncbi:hypothetical protein Tco_0912921 [Tanacetum coccineum]
MTSPPHHQAAYQAPPSPPWPPSLALSPTCSPLYTKPPQHPLPCIATLYSFLESPISLLSHHTTALDP